jgi:hypothetical protein
MQESEFWDRIRRHYGTAFPITGFPLGGTVYNSVGITTRAYVATAILAGRMSGAEIKPDREAIYADIAVRLADALLARLEQ